MSRIAMALVAGCLFAFPIASPMAQSDKPLAFEVASIKPRQASDTSRWSEPRPPRTPASPSPPQSDAPTSVAAARSAA